MNQQKSWMVLVCFFLNAAASHAQPDVTAQRIEKLSQLKLEDLIVTSVSKKSEKLFDAAAAVSVITNEELHRAGVTSLPEALRLVPGMEVARLDGTKWAISTRGFTDRFATKLLVLIDGRAVYQPAFGGVYWDVQDYLLEDIDRIEVIRGPGGTLWGECGQWRDQHHYQGSKSTTEDISPEGMEPKKRLRSCSIRQALGRRILRAYLKYRNTDEMILERASTLMTPRNNSRWLQVRLAPGSERIHSAGRLLLRESPGAKRRTNLRAAHGIVRSDDTRVKGKYSVALDAFFRQRH
jgi:hypothetical protein